MNETRLTATATTAASAGASKAVAVATEVGPVVAEVELKPLAIPGDLPLSPTRDRRASGWVLGTLSAVHRRGRPADADRRGLSDRDRCAEVQFLGKLHRAIDHAAEPGPARDHRAAERSTRR